VFLFAHHYYGRWFILADIGDFTSALWNTTKTRIVNPALANPTTTIEGPTNLLDEEIAESSG